MKKARDARWRIAVVHLAWFIVPGIAGAQAPPPAPDPIGQPIVEVIVEQEQQIVTDAAVRGLIETTVGEPLSMADVRETIDHLMNLRRYDDVRPTAEPAPGGVRLRYVLVPAHPVDRVEFRGMLGVEERDLRRLITERYGRAPGASRADEAADLLRRAYRRRGYPSATVEPRLAQTHNPDRATLIFDISSGRRARIADIRLEQLDDDAESTITGTPDITVGQFYDAEAVEEELRRWEDRFKERGYYEARASYAANIADDAYLVVRLRRGQRVTVAFTGDPLPESERDRLVPVRAEASADEDLLEDARINIEQYLRARGYRDAAAPYTRREAAGEVTITFDVRRGPRYVVGAVAVNGNTALTDGEVRRIVDLDEQSPFVRSTLDARAADLQNIYRSLGYTQARVEATTAVLPGAGGDRPIEITVTVAEGPRVLVRSVVFEGNAAIPEPTLRGWTLPKPGAPYSQPEVAASRDRILVEYRNRGYEAAKVTDIVTPSEGGTDVDVRYAVAEGPQSIIDHIIIVGNERTSTETITNELLFREGDPLGQSALVESRARLAALQIFRRVDVQPLQHTTGSRRDVLIQVEEDDPTTLDFRGGVEGTYRLRTGTGGLSEERLELAPRGGVGIGRRNFWGKNRSVNLFTRVSLRSTDILVDEGAAPLDSSRIERNQGFNEYRIVTTFREPRVFASRTDVVVTGIVEQAIRTTFNFSRRIVRAETGLRTARTLTLTGAYSFERTKLFDEIFTPEEKPLIDRYFSEVRLSKFAASLLRDTRDEPLDASRGTFLIVDGDLAARAIGSEVGFLRLSAQASTYFQVPAPRRIVLALSGRVGAARGFPREVPRVDVDGLAVLAPDGAQVIDVLRDLPASERFFAGGDTSVRGFSLDRLGTAETIGPGGFPLGGNGMVVLNGEIRFTVGGLWQVVGFVDAGNVFRRASDIDLADLRPTPGIGVRYQSFGTIRLDLGFNLDRRELSPGRLERGNVLHVSLGQAF